MKTKHNVFVPVGSQQEAERMEKVLRAMGEEVRKDFYSNTCLDKPDLELRKNGWILGVATRERTQITFGELIDILSKTEKIAVKVDNEREFKALMKYYDGLGWTSLGGDKPNIVAFNAEELKWSFHDNFGSSRTYHDNAGYTIIPFQDFAKEHNIKVPLLISEDGVELFEGDKLFEVSLTRSKSNPYLVNADSGVGYWTLDGNNNARWMLPEFHEYHSKAFSTKESALKWIEEQKPKPIQLLHGMKCIIKEKVSKNHEIEIYDADELVTVLYPSDIEAISKAMEDLK